MLPLNKVILVAWKQSAAMPFTAQPTPMRLRRKGSNASKPSSLRSFNASRTHCRTGRMKVRRPSGTLTHSGLLPRMTIFCTALALNSAPRPVRLFSVRVALIHVFGIKLL